MVLILFIPILLCREHNPLHLDLNEDRLFILVIAQQNMLLSSVLFSSIVLMIFRNGGLTDPALCRQKGKIATAC